MTVYFKKNAEFSNDGSLEVNLDEKVALESPKSKGEQEEIAI